MDQQQIIALCGMDRSLYQLAALYCRQHPSEQEITDWFSGIEFETLRPEVSCMAAAMAAANGYKGAPLELVPRLRGIIRYVHTLNSGMTAGLCALGKQFQEAGIPAVLQGGTAVHLGYPDWPCRHLWRTEIGVSEADFPQAAALAETAGFTVERTPYSVTARQGNTQCIFIRNGMGCTSGRTALTISGVPFLMPCGPELLVSLAEDICQILLGSAPEVKLISRIMDLHCLIPTVSDWEAAAAAAKKRGSDAQMRLVLELYDALAPNTLTGKIPALFATAEETIQLMQLILNYRNLKPGSARLKRLWIYAQITQGNSRLASLAAFFKALCRAGFRKITLEN